MIPDIEVSSNFAALDVKRGRHELAAHFRQTPRGELTPRHRWVPVTITGWMTGINSDDDGVSREFQVDVTSVRLSHDAPVSEVTA